MCHNTSDEYSMGDNWHCSECGELLDDAALRRDDELCTFCRMEDEWAIADEYADNFDHVTTQSKLCLMED